MPLAAVFDTNIVIFAILFGRRMAWLTAAWRTGRAVPVVCDEAVDELLRVLAYPKFRLDPAERRQALDCYILFAQTVPSTTGLADLPVRSRDADDDIWLRLALSAGVMIVSGDKDLSSLTGGPIIMSAAQFQAMLAAAR